MLGQLHLIRAFEETVLALAGEGLVHGPAHSSIGQEGGAVGSIVSLRSTDAVNGSHRGHHQFLAKALSHVTKGTLDLSRLVTAEVAEVLQRTLAEILGLAQGYCSGRGGSMHLQWLQAGALGTNAIVGGGVPMAAGNAWAQRHGASGDDGTDLTVTYFGDGAVNIGSVLETMNLASAWKLPLCFFIENNGYAVSTTVAEATGEPRLSARALGFGITAWQVDGMDPLAVHLVMERAAERLRSGRGPVVVEIYQNCPVFNDGAFSALTEKDTKDANQIRLEAGRPIRFGVENERGVGRGADGGLAIVDVAEVGEDALIVHDPSRPDPGLAFSLARLRRQPDRAHADRDLPPSRAPGVRTQQPGSLDPSHRRRVVGSAARRGQLDRPLSS